MSYRDQSIDYYMNKYNKYQNKLNLLLNNQNGGEVVYKKDVSRINHIKINHIIRDDNSIDIEFIDEQLPDDLTGTENNLVAFFHWNSGQIKLNRINWQNLTSKKYNQIMQKNYLKKQINNIFDNIESESNFQSTELELYKNKYDKCFTINAIKELMKYETFQKWINDKSININNFNLNKFIYNI